MNVFIFSSHSETQGIVLTEAMACGIPVLAIDAPAVRELVKDQQNGRLIPFDNQEEFVAALEWFVHCDFQKWQQLKSAARQTVGYFSIEQVAHEELEIYQDLIFNNRLKVKESHLWETVKDLLKTEKDLLRNAIEATEAALMKDITQ